MHYLLVKVRLKFFSQFGVPRFDKIGSVREDDRRDTFVAMIDLLDEFTGFGIVGDVYFLERHIVLQEYPARLPAIRTPGFAINHDCFWGKGIETVGRHYRGRVGVSILRPSSSSVGSMRMVPSGKMRVGIRTRRVSFSMKVKASRSFPMSTSICWTFCVVMNVRERRQSGHHVVEYMTILLGFGL